MIDTHTHLNFIDFEPDLSDVLSRMKDAGVISAIVVGTDDESNISAINLANQYEQLYAAIGIHPSDVKGDFDISDLKNLTKSPKVVAIGEVGLDYSYDVDHGLQARAFEEFMALSAQSNLPLIIHCRDAMDDLITVLSKSNQVTGVVHCFTGTLAQANRLIALGLHISFTGMITYPKNEELRQVILNLPHDKVLVETDCPFLPPQSKRGKRCEPKDMVEVAAAIGQIWDKNVEYVDKVTSDNARRLFKIK
ncbi:MAG: TatD family hydrolase [Patescibacteria group bacterium]|jgi:TatD DNase family protein